jgi:Ca2+-binding EF-hand superfamily protein
MAFAAFDLDHDGSVTPEELRAGLAAAATAPLDEERVAELIAELDADGDGSVSREEYSAGLMRRYRRTLAPVA